MNDDMTNDTALESTGRKYRLGIALSGGGARGFAHAGALMAIEEAGLKPDVVAGVSAGSVVAVLYAAGVRPADIPRLFSNAGMSDFTTLSLGQGGLLSAEKFKKFVMKAIGGYTRLEDLPMPVYIGVTDFDRGVATEFHRGPIGDVMLASCSIPIVFRPVNIDGVNYVDGGVLRNHPAWILRDKCDKLIGINVSPLVLGKAKDRAAAVEAFKALIRHILETSDDAVALVPHVTWEHDNDLDALSEIREPFMDESRVLMLPATLDAQMLKGYISRMKALVTARTHASIAGYSSCVPTLVIGYSVKARGIARDLFGSEEGHLLPVQELHSAEQLIGAYDALIARGPDERNYLIHKLPEYKRELDEVAYAVMKLEG